MKISKRFNLEKSQAELDFVDIDTSRDIPLFLDPHFLGQRKDNWSTEAVQTLRSFFQTLLDLIREGNEKEARKLFNNLHEPNSTCLGLSAYKPDGNGVGQGDSENIFDRLLKSKAVKTGLIQDIEDNILFIDRFGKDKLSDMTTNIIRKHLILYTQNQCNLHNIPLNSNIPSGFFWDKEDCEWKNEYINALVVDGKQILLIPKGIVSFSEAYIPRKYYNNFVLDYLQHEHIRLNSALVRERKNGKKFVTKKDLKEQYPNSKEFLIEFTLAHPEVLERFKRELGINPLKNVEISEVNIKQICSILGEQLTEIPMGNAEASNYHKKVMGIIQVLFYPKLINPFKEREILQGRKRIDIVFDNASTDGIFSRIANHLHLFCPYIFFECKNYSSDPANPELDQISGRFSNQRGRVGFLLCRKLNDKDLFKQRCKDTYNDGRGLVIPLDDQDIINLLDNFDERNNDFFETYISNLVREITLN